VAGSTAECWWPSGKRPTSASQPQADGLRRGPFLSAG
jgi:hypothetical protein